MLGLRWAALYSLTGVTDTSVDQAGSDSGTLGEATTLLKQNLVPTDTDAFTLGEDENVDVVGSGVQKVGSDAFTLGDGYTEVGTSGDGDGGTLGEDTALDTGTTEFKVGSDAFTLAESHVLGNTVGGDNLTFNDGFTDLISDEADDPILSETTVLSVVVVASDPFVLEVEDGDILGVNVAPTGEETYTLGELGVPNITVPDTDSGSLGEATDVVKVSGPLDIQLSQADSGTLGESTTLLESEAKTDTDSATLTEAKDLFATGTLPLDSEDFAATSSVTTLDAAVVASDSGTLTEAGDFTAAYVNADAGTFGESVTLTVVVVGTDAFLMVQEGDNGLSEGELLGTVTLFPDANGAVTLEPDLGASTVLLGQLHAGITIGV